MNPETKGYYWQHNVLKPDNPYHHEILNLLERYYMNGIEKEYLYKVRLTDVLPKDHKICEMAVKMRRLRAGAKGLFVSMNLDGKSYEISQAFAGTMIRNELQTVVCDMNKALSQHKDEGLKPYPIYVLTYPSRYNGHIHDFNRSYLFDLLMWAERKGVFIVVFHDAANESELLLSIDEIQFINKKYGVIGKLQ